MAAETKTRGLDFVAMPSIAKNLGWNDNSSDWVATEKVHGASFQFYTSDGVNFHVASRRRELDTDGSFLKCNIKNFLGSYEGHIKRVWEIIVNEEKWGVYRSVYRGFVNDDDEGVDVNDQGNDEEERENQESNGEVKANGAEEKGNLHENHDQPQEKTEIKDDANCIHLRIYGELYGGGGVDTDPKPAVQKEIIYSDEFRFYVFGITINRKWVTMAELNEICRQAGFPYYAMPVCEPKTTLRELRDWLLENNFLGSRSRLTDRKDDRKTFIEGVVMTPLTRKDFRLHAVKLLASAFNDVRTQGCKTKSLKLPKVNYCTKPRYHSVLSKLDTHEREQGDLVADMFVEDIIKESGDIQVSDKVKGIWRSVVIRWLTEDGYLGNPNSGENKRRDTIKETKLNGGNLDAQEDEESGGFFGILS